MAKTKRRCRACGKRDFDGKLAAENSLARITRVDDASRAKIPSRAYQCPFGTGWHLTSETEVPAWIQAVADAEACWGPEDSQDAADDRDDQDAEASAVSGAREMMSA